MSEYSKIPPQALDLEQAVLGAMLIDKDALDQVLNILSKDDFYKPAHQVIFETMADLYNLGPVPLGLRGRGLCVNR
jgi:replicative DNA helicase